MHACRSTLEDPTLSGYIEDAGDWTSSTRWKLDDRGFVAREDLAFGDTAVTRDYAYDARGYLTHADDVSYTYDAAGLQDRHTGGRVYDARGRLVQKGDLTLEYGPHGHLARATRGADVFTYVYDESGNRLLKRKNGLPVAAYVDDGMLTEDGLVLPLELAGRVIGVLEGSELHLLVTDPRGTVLSDRDGTPRLATPYGERETRPDLSAALDYARKGLDPDLGLVRMGMRDYDPGIGSFTTPDPLFLAEIDKCAGSPLECNLYSYARNNPLAFTDPNGTDAIEVVWRHIIEMNMKVVPDNFTGPLRNNEIRSADAGKLAKAFSNIVQDKSMKVTGDIDDQGKWVVYLLRASKDSPSFRDTLIEVGNDTTKTQDIKLCRGCGGGVFVDEFSSNKVDLNDIEMFPDTPSAASPDEMTSLENVVHIVAERRSAVLSANPADFGPAHRDGTAAHNKYRAERGQSAEKVGNPATDNGDGTFDVKFNYDNGNSTTVTLDGNADVVKVTK